MNQHDDSMEAEGEELYADIVDPMLALQRRLGFVEEGRLCDLGFFAG